jgi:hypothetical protein
MKTFLLTILLFSTYTLQAQYSRPPADSILDLHYNKLLPMELITPKPKIQWIPDAAMSPQALEARRRYMRVRWMTETGACLATAGLIMGLTFMSIPETRASTRNTLISLSAGLVAGLTLPILPRKRYNKMRDSYNPEALKYYGFK